MTRRAPGPRCLDQFLQQAAQPIEHRRVLDVVAWQGIRGHGRDGRLTRTLDHLRAMDRGDGQQALCAKKRLTAVGGDVTPGASTQFAALVRSERQRYDKLVQETRIKPD